MDITESKKTRKRGDWRDDRRVKAPGLQTIMCYLRPWVRALRQLWKT